MLRPEIEKILNVHLPGYLLIGPERANTNNKLQLQCTKGHHWPKARLHNIIHRDAKCPVCVNEDRSAQFLVKPNEIRSKLDLMGWEMLSEYKGMHFNVMVKCKKCGFIKDSRACNIKNRCKQCKNESTREDTMDTLMKILGGKSYRLLEVLTENVKLSAAKLLIKCDNPEHPPYTNTYRNIVHRNQECGLCRNNKRLTIDIVRSRLDVGDSVEGTYLGEHSWLKFTFAKCGHSGMLTWSKYQHGVRCPCERKNINLTEEEVKKRMAERGYEWVGGTYENVYSVLFLKCKKPTHQIFQKQFVRTYDTNELCPECFSSGNSMGGIKIA